jgi:hypothetical protein
VLGLVVALGLAAGAVVLIRSIWPSAGQAGPPDSGVHGVNRTMYDDGGHTVTLTSFDVQASGRLRVNIRYQNSSTVVWALSCPAADTDLHSSYLTLADGRRAYPESTWCSSQAPGQTVPLQPGAALDSWAVFPSTPARGARYSLNWYDMPTVSNLAL